MIKKAQQFEPQNQITGAFDELQKAMLDAQAAISRVSWLKDKLLSEFDAVQEKAEELQIFTEAEAAEIMKVEVKHLADLRRRLDLPFISLGNKPRYTKTHILEICSILEINNKKKTTGRKAA